MQRVGFFSPAPQVAFGLELNALSDDQMPLSRAVTVALEGMTKARIPFIRVCTVITSVLSPCIQLEPLLLHELVGWSCARSICNGETVISSPFLPTCIKIKSISALKHLQN